MAVTLTRGQFIDIGDRHRSSIAPVLSRELFRALAVRKDDRRVRTLDYKIVGKVRQGRRLKREMMEGTGERARVRGVNAGMTV